MEVYTSDSDSSDTREQKTLDYGRLRLRSECFEDNIQHLYKTEQSYRDIETILLNHNTFTKLPASIVKFTHLKVLDLSSNRLTQLPQELMQLPLVTLVAKNNQLTNKSLPKALTNSSNGGTLKEINLSGNLLTHFPEQVVELKNLRYLYLGANRIKDISKDIWKLQG